MYRNMPKAQQTQDRKKIVYLITGICSGMWTAVEKVSERWTRWQKWETSSTENMGTCTSWWGFSGQPISSGTQETGKYSIKYMLTLILSHMVTVLRIRNRDPVPFWPLDPGSGRGFSGSRIPNPYFWELNDNFLGKNFYIHFFLNWPNFFLHQFKIKIMLNFVIFVATKKGRTIKYFSTISPSKNLSILTPPQKKKLFQSSRKYDPGCSSRIQDSGSGCWLSTHPGSRGQKGTGSRIQIRNTVCS